MEKKKKKAKNYSEVSPHTSQSDHHQNVSVEFSHSVVSDSLQPHKLQHTRLPCPSPTPEAYLNSCPLSQ